MRLNTATTIAAMTKDQLTERLGAKCEEKSEQELRELLFRTEKTQSLCMWHDHATILKMGFVMITVHVMYDSLVFYTIKSCILELLNLKWSNQRYISSQLVPPVSKTMQH